MASFLQAISIYYNFLARLDSSDSLALVLLRFYLQIVAIMRLCSHEFGNLKSNAAVSSQTFLVF